MLPNGRTQPEGGRHHDGHGRRPLTELLRGGALRGLIKESDEGGIAAVACMQHQRPQGSATHILHPIGPE